MPSTVFTTNQLNVLKTFLDQFRQASGNDKQDVIKQAAQVLLQEMGDTTKPERYAIRKRVKVWLYNNGRKTNGRTLTRARKYTFRHVVAYEKKRQLEEEVRMLSKAEPGTGQYFAKYQGALKSICEALDEDEKDEYTAIAKEWNEQQPPTEVQRMAAEKYGKKFVKEFTTRMRRELGMKILVLTAHVNPTGGVDCSALEFEDRNNHQQFTDAYPNWDTEAGLIKHWNRYAEAYFDINHSDNSDADESVDMKPIKQRREPINITYHEDGQPVFPEFDTDDMPKLIWQKDFIRAYVTAQYRFETNNNKVNVPWIAIQHDNAHFIQAKYLPLNAGLGDPSKMVQREVTAFIDHWQTRTQANKIPFQFHGYLDNHYKQKAPKNNNAEAGPSKRTQVAAGMERGHRRFQHRTGADGGAEETPDTSVPRPRPPPNKASGYGNAKENEQAGPSKKTQVAAGMQMGHRRVQHTTEVDGEAQGNAHAPVPRPRPQPKTASGHGNATGSHVPEHGRKETEGSKGRGAKALQTVGTARPHSSESDHRHRTNDMGPHQGGNHNQGKQRFRSPTPSAIMEGVDDDEDDGLRTPPRDRHSASAWVLGTYHDPRQAVSQTSKQRKGKGRAVEVNDKSSDVGSEHDDSLDSSEDEDFSFFGGPVQKVLSDEAFMLSRRLVPAQVQDRHRFLNMFPDDQVFAQLLKRLRKYEPTIQTTAEPMTGQPSWVSWDSENYCIPPSFEGKSLDFGEALDWCLEGHHIDVQEPKQIRLLNYATVELWALGWALIKRDMTHLVKCKNDFPEARERIDMWDDARLTRYRRVVLDTCNLLDNEYGDAGTTPDTGSQDFQAQKQPPNQTDSQAWSGVKSTARPHFGSSVQAGTQRLVSHPQPRALHQTGKDADTQQLGQSSGEVLLLPPHAGWSNRHHAERGSDTRANTPPPTSSPVGNDDDDAGNTTGDLEEAQYDGADAPGADDASSEDARADRSHADLGPVLMTKSDFARGLAVPPLCNEPPSKSIRKKQAYLEKLLVTPALKKLYEALEAYPPLTSSRLYLMPDKPTWLTWTYSNFALPEPTVNIRQVWRDNIHWILSAPHLTSNHDSTRNYPTTQLWALGLGMIIQHLLRQYAEHIADGIPDADLGLLVHWINYHDFQAQTLIWETIDLLRLEHSSGQDDSDHSQPTPVQDMTDNNQRHVLTRSLTRQSQSEGAGLRPGLKRRQHDTDELPVIGESAEAGPSAPKRKRRA